MIFHTAEIRWFYPGSIPEEVKKWFSNLDGQFEEQLPRTDQYLKLCGSNTLGIKIREGRFEVKEKQSKEEKILSINSVEGFAEMWQKWSFDSVDNKYHLNELIKGEFIAIKKARQLQKYIFDSKGNISAGFDNFKSDGCNLELTKVCHSSDDLKSSDESNEWWTLGLETYGKRENLKKNLNIAFDHIFQTTFPGILNKDKSFGYPKWLMSLEIHKFFQ